MPRSALLIAALILAGCDLLPKPVASRDTIARAPQPGARDTMSDAAAAESAKVFARAEAVRNAPMAIHITGAQSYSADSGFHVSCIASESNGEQLLQVEALGRDVRVNFTIYNARDGSVPVGNIYTRRRAKSRIGNFQVSLRTKSFADGTGKAQITDPIGRTGTMSAGSFVKMGVKKNESHHAGITVRLRWNCE